MKRKALPEILDELGEKRIVITAHRKADIDAVASIFAINEKLDDAVIAVSEETDEGAENLLAHLGVPVTDLEALNPEHYDGLVLLDTSTSVLVPSAKNWKVVLVIDHHQPEGRDIEGEYNIIEPDVPSTSEIIANGLDFNVSAKAAFALSCGIVSDTARFKSARKETFLTLGKLMEISGSTYEEILKYSDYEKKKDERIAILKGFQRTQFFEAGWYLLATSQVGSHGSDVASFLAEVAHASFVGDYKEREDETRISSRASKEFPVALNEVMSKVGKELGGEGGGHKKAAGCSIKGQRVDETLQKCVEITREMLKLR